MTGQAVLHYASVSMKPRMKDRILRLYFAGQTAAVMLSSSTALSMQSETQKYPRDPEVCEHPNGLRAYGAAKTKIKICDQCGSRWVVQAGGLQPAQPKASPTAKTPLFDKGKKGPVSSSGSAASWDGSSQHSWQQVQAYPPPAPSRAAQSKSRSRPVPIPTTRARPSMDQIYNTPVSEMTDEQVALLHQRWEELMERDRLAHDYDWENREADPMDWLQEDQYVPGWPNPAEQQLEEEEET